MRLRRSTVGGPGLRRVCTGAGAVSARPGYFRAGGEVYAEENSSYGIATLLCEHVTVRSNAVLFDYPANYGIQRTWEIEDPVVVAAVNELRRAGPGAAQARTAAMIRKVARGPGLEPA